MNSPDRSAGVPPATETRQDTGATTIRLLSEGPGISSAHGLAGDELLAKLVADGACGPALRLYRYRPSVIVGRYQNLTDAINLDACHRHGYEWNRRHTGGGTVVMSPGALAIGLVLPERDGGICTIRRHFEFFAGLLADALSSFDVKAELAGKNDLAICGRKVAGLAISQDIDGAVFFHGSLLLDFDVALMVDLLNLSTRELDDRGQSCFAQRMTTIAEHAPGVSFELLEREIVKSLSARMALPVGIASWTGKEAAALGDLKRTRYENEDWVYSTRVMRRWSGVAERRTSGGNLRLYVDRNGGVIDAVLITGDYFSRSIEIASLEARLRGTPARSESILRAIGAESDNPIYRVPAGELAELILKAAESPAPARFRA